MAGKNKKSIDDRMNQDLKNWETETCLELDVKKMVLNAIEIRGSSTKGFFNDLLIRCGCKGGIISELISNDDTTKFYEKHKDEIQNIIKIYMDEMGITSPKEIFLEDWEEDDYFCNEYTNKNILAWFAFEETARKISDGLGMNL